MSDAVSQAIGYLRLIATVLEKERAWLAPQIAEGRELRKDLVSMYLEYDPEHAATISELDTPTLISAQVDKHLENLEKAATQIATLADFFEAKAAGGTQ